MQEGSPPTSEAGSAEAEVTSPPAEPTEGEVAEVTNAERTPDEVEAIWKNRVAGKDRAHAAETAALREQIDGLNRQMQGRQTEEAAQASESDQWKAKFEESERTRTEEARRHAVEIRTAKYAAAAEALDEATLGSMDEGKLAALNARLTEGEAPPPPVVDPSSARRPTPGTSTAPRDRSIEELESDLQKQAPAFVESLNT